MAASEQYDVLLTGGTVIDGTGAARVRADVAVAGDRIAAVGDLAGAQAARTVDATGRIVSPGFIDAHTHDDNLLLVDPDVTPKTSQGVTTVIAGNCGVSLAPLTPGRPGAAAVRPAGPARRLPLSTLCRLCSRARRGAAGRQCRLAGRPFGAPPRHHGRRGPPGDGHRDRRHARATGRGDGGRGLGFQYRAHLRPQQGGDHRRGRGGGRGRRRRRRALRHPHAQRARRHRGGDGGGLRDRPPRRRRRGHLPTTSAPGDRISGGAATRSRCSTRPASTSRSASMSIPTPQAPRC